MGAYLGCTLIAVIMMSVFGLSVGRTLERIANALEKIAGERKLP